jgi:hypothetical protein
MNVLSYTTAEGSNKPRGLALVVAAAIIIGIGWSVGIDIYERFYLAIQNTLMDRYAKELDRSIIDSAAGDGLFIHYIGFEGPRRGYCTNVYFRANYILFPKRVLVGDPSAPINTGDQVLAANFRPDAKWLVEHDVPALLSIAVHVDPLTGRLDFRYASLHAEATTQP